MNGVIGWRNTADTSSARTAAATPTRCIVPGRLCASLTTFSIFQIEANKLTLEPIPFNFRQVEDVGNVWEGRERSGVSIARPKLPAPMSGDPAHRRCWATSRNAIKFTQRGRVLVR